jgi:hypothetical protein
MTAILTTGAGTPSGCPQHVGRQPLKRVAGAIALLVVTLPDFVIVQCFPVFVPLTLQIGSL